MKKSIIRPRHTYLELWLAASLVLVSLGLLTTFLKAMPYGPMFLVAGIGMALLAPIIKDYQSSKIKPKPITKEEPMIEKQKRSLSYHLNLLFLTLVVVGGIMAATGHFLLGLASAAVGLVIFGFSQAQMDLMALDTVKIRSRKRR